MTPLQGVVMIESIIVGIDVDWNQIALIFEKSNLEWVQNKSDIGFFHSIECDQFLTEFLTEFLLTHIERGSVANLQGSGSDDSGLLKAGVGSCWFNHGNH